MNYERYSSMDKLLRITNYVLRFVFNLRAKVNKDIEFRHGDISTEEISCSKKLWIEYEQKDIANNSKI